MATRFGTIRTLPYNGIPQAAATGICTPSVQSPKMVPLQIDWNVYWQAAGNPTSVGVEVNLQGTTPDGASLDRIRSIKIDNTFSTSPIYALFPDTGDVVSCPPQTSIILPVNTNAQKLVLYAQNLAAGFIPYTIVYLFNVAIPPVVDPAIQTTYPQWLGSNLIQRDNILTPGFGPPVLGDQVTSAAITLNSPSSTVLFGSPLASGYIYIQSMFVRVFGARNPTNTLCDVDLTANAISLFNWQYFVVASGADIDVCLYQGHGMNIKLDATKTYRFIQNQSLQNPQGRAYIMITYSVNSN